LRFAHFRVPGQNGEEFVSIGQQRQRLKQSLTPNNFGLPDTSCQRKAHWRVEAEAAISKALAATSRKNQELY
jgi:hypothetical protein